VRKSSEYLKLRSPHPNERRSSTKEFPDSARILLLDLFACRIIIGARRRTRIQSLGPYMSSPLCLNVAQLYLRHSLKTGLVILLAAFAAFAFLQFRATPAGKRDRVIASPERADADLALELTARLKASGWQDASAQAVVSLNLDRYRWLRESADVILEREFKAYEALRPDGEIAQLLERHPRWPGRQPDQCSMRNGAAGGAASTHPPTLTNWQIKDLTPEAWAKQQQVDLRATA
jgi:hypothetical protein